MGRMTSDRSTSAAYFMAACNPSRVRVGWESRICSMDSPADSLHQDQLHGDPRSCHHRLAHHDVGVRHNPGVCHKRLRHDRPFNGSSLLLLEPEALELQGAAALVHDVPAVFGDALGVAQSPRHVCAARPIQQVPRARGEPRACSKVPLASDASWEAEPHPVSAQRRQPRSRLRGIPARATVSTWTGPPPPTTAFTPPS